MLVHRFCFGSSRRLDIFRETSLIALLNGKLESRDARTLEAIASAAWFVRKGVRLYNDLFPFHVVLTERARLDLIRQYNIEASRVVVIHHSMDVDKYGRDVAKGAAFRRRWNVPESQATVFGFAGMLHETKGLDMLIDSAPEIVNSGKVGAYSELLLYINLCACTACLTPF